MITRYELLVITESDYLRIKIRIKKAQHTNYYRARYKTGLVERPISNLWCFHSSKTCWDEIIVHTQKFRTSSHMTGQQQKESSRCPERARHEEDVPFADRTRYLQI